MRSMTLCGAWFFFFQAEDGIRDYKVTGVQTCALPILRLQRCVLAGEPIEQLPHTACLELDRVSPAHERAERRRDQNRHCHTTFRSSLVIGSWSNVPRSCARTQLFNSPARP